MVMLVQKLSVLFILILSLSMVLNTGQWLSYARGIMSSSGKGIPLSLIMLTVGLLIVLNHNLWTSEVTILVSLFGWLMVVYSALFLIYPRILDLFRHLSDDILRQNILLLGGIFSLLSVFLIFKLFLI